MWKVNVEAGGEIMTVANDLSLDEALETWRYYTATTTRQQHRSAMVVYWIEEQA